MVQEIIDFLLENDDPVIPEAEDFEDAEEAKEIWADPESDWEMRPGDVHWLYDPSGRATNYSNSLRGIRQYVSRRLVRRVEIREFHGPHQGEGGIKVTFDDDYYWLGRFADFGVLKWVLRNWRNLYGAPLFVNDNPAGKIDYHNPVLQEAETDDFDSEEDFKDVYGPDQEQIYSLDEIKAAEPMFFSRKTIRFHGTKKIYKYGNFLVVHNVKHMAGHTFGFGDWTYNRYAIYHFRKTYDSPKGFLLYRGDARELTDAKHMIKSNDFRSRRERLGLPESEDEDEDFKEVFQADQWAYEVRPERIHWKPWVLVIYHYGESVGKEYFDDWGRAEAYGKKLVAVAERIERYDPYQGWPHVWAWLDHHHINIDTVRLLPEARPFQVVTRQLSKAEAHEMGYDVSEMQEFPVMRMSIQGSFMDYEEGPNGIWILYVETEQKFQNQGRAKYLLEALKRYADKHEKSVIHGTFTEEGEKYLKPVVRRLWKKDLMAGGGF